MKKAEKQDIKNEEDLFAKLDALELQEELEAELHRYCEYFHLVLHFFFG